MPADSFFQHRGLIALAAGTAAGEAVLLTVLAPAARPLAPQVTAIPPLAVLHDMRWLADFGTSWLGLALGFAGLVIARSVLSASMIRLAWPRDRPSPRLARVAGRFAIYTIIASALLSPIVTLLVGVSVLPFSWPFLVALPTMLLVTIPLSHGGVLGSWWRTLPPITAVGWLLASYALLSAAAAAMTALPAAPAVIIAGLAGVANARAWYGVVSAVTRREAATPAPAASAVRAALQHLVRRVTAGAWPAPVSPLAAAIALVLVMAIVRTAFVLVVDTPFPVGGARAAAAIGTAPRAADVERVRPRAGGGLHQAVLIIPGFGSSCCGPSPVLARIGPPNLVRRFSYLGLGPGGRPLPYGLGATDLPLPLLGDRIAAQVQRLHAETGMPVAVVAESEGTLGVYAMFARHPAVPVSSVVLLSPIVEPGRSGLSGSGPGPVAGDALTALVRLAGSLSPYGQSGAQQLIASVRRDGAAFAAAAAERSGRFRWLSVIPLADALTLPSCSLPHNAIVVPALHGTLLTDPRVDRIVHDFLIGRPVSGPQEMRDAAEVIASATQAWQMPDPRAGPLRCTD